MKALVLLFFVGCASFNIGEPVNRYGAILQDNGDFGSAVSVGNGYFLTVTHVIADSGRYLLVWSEGIDSAFSIAWSRGDVSLLRSVGDAEPAVYGSVEIGDEVMLVQPILTPERSIRLKLFTARVSALSDSVVEFDHPVFPGVSGSGLFTRRGELVGIVVSLNVVYDQVISGNAILLGTLIERIEWKTKGGVP